MATQLEPAKVALHVLDCLLEGCQVVGFDCRYLYVNRTVAQQARREPEDLLGRTMAECFPGIERSAMYAELQRCMRDRAHHRMVNEFPFPDGTTGWFELRFIPVPEGTCILSVDITPQKRAQAALSKSEDQLRQSQKMDAIGRLAGGVAHDFNNLLSVILSYATLAREQLGDEHAVTPDLREIEAASRRAAQLTSQLLAISRQQVVERRVLDVNEIVGDVCRMLRRLVGENVELRTRLARDLSPVLGDAGHVEQILLNLAVNARDAMPQGGTLTIETASVMLDEAATSGRLDTTPVPHVMIAVSDTGVGMDRETQARIFEPFFTTKPKGKGTGLGLSTVFGIVQQSGGFVWVYSEPGRGTTFKIYFPAIPKDHAPDAPSREAADHRRAGSGRVNGHPPPRATVLLVEDDAQVRKLTRSILERDGYTVIVAESAADALRIAAENGRIDVLCTDVVMPGMNGPELAQAIRARRPGVKVLYMSGYTGDVVVHHGVPDHGLAFVQKPLTPASLSRAVEQVLSGD